MPVDERERQRPQPVRLCAMRPLLKPALRRFWRDSTTVQIGVTRARAVVLCGMPPWAGPVLDALDGSRDLNGLMHIAHEHGADEPALHQLLNALSEAGVLDDATHGLEPLASLTREERDRIAPDVAALALAHPQPGGAMAALQSRRTTSIVVDGLGRVGSAIAMLLTAAGVGTVVPRDGRPRQPS